MSDSKEMADMLNRYFSSVFTSERDEPPVVQEMFVRNRLENITVTAKKVRDKILALKPDSAPGPDGITYSFLKYLWPIYGKILIDSWNYGIMTGKMAPSHNSSTLTLLPKEGKNLQELKNWRPITLSNCDLKLITKTLSKRMTTTLDDVISNNQTAYMEHRSISDNLRLINLALRESESQNKNISIVALDAKKAFDLVRH